MADHNSTCSYLVLILARQVLEQSCLKQHKMNRSGSWCASDKSETRHSMTRREMLALINVSQHFRHYLLGLCSCTHRQSSTTVASFISRARNSGGVLTGGVAGVRFYAQIPKLTNKRRLYVMYILFLWYH